MHPWAGIEALATRTIAERDHVAAGRRAPTGADQPRAHLGKIRNARTTNPRIHRSARGPALRLAVTRAAAAPRIRSSRPRRLVHDLLRLRAPRHRRRRSHHRGPQVRSLRRRRRGRPRRAAALPSRPRRRGRPRLLPPVLFPPFPVALEPPVEPAIPAPPPACPAELPPVADPPAPPLPLVPPSPVPAGPESLPHATKAEQGQRAGEGHQGLTAPSAVHVAARVCNRMASVSNVSSPRLVHEISGFDYW